MDLLKQKDSYKKISSDINNFVVEQLKNYSANGLERKTIHDPIWGSNDYSEWEMQIIDSPLLQRLRNISQVGLAVLTYPAARHSRFEHTLGVAAATKRIVDRINLNCENIVIKEDIRNKLVLAAIMHDVGHCFYSHLSETIFGNLEDFVHLRNDIKKIYNVKPKPHEIMSLLIVNCEAFVDFMSNSVNYPSKKNLEKTLEDVGKIIIGVNIRESNTILSYQTSIINGTFDVDKLDYIKRDSYTAGLALDFDIERLFTKIIVKDVVVQEGLIEKRLMLNASGVTAIEELTFCKIMLFSYIYYHQKVLITENMISDYVHGLLELGLIKSYSDFLRLSEFDLLKLADKQNDKKPYPEIGEMNLCNLADNIKNRILPKRCLEISQSLLQHAHFSISETEIEQDCEKILQEIRNNPDYNSEDLLQYISKVFSVSTSSPTRYLLGFLSKYNEKSYGELLLVRKEIYTEICGIYKKNKRDVNFDVFDIYFVLPSIVSYGATNEKIICGRSEEYLTIDDFVKLDQWAASFNAYKWRGYVYVTDKIDKKIALEACRKVIFEDKVRLDDLKIYLKK